MAQEVILEVVPMRDEARPQDRTTEFVRRPARGWEERLPPIPTPPEPQPEESV